MMVVNVTAFLEFRQNRRVAAKERKENMVELLAVLHF